MNLTQLEQFSRLDPDNLSLRLSLAEQYLWAGRPDDAWRTLERGAGEEPRVRFLRARIHLQRGEFRAVVALLRPMAEAPGATAVLWHDLGFAQLCLRELEAAETSVQRGLLHEELPELYVLWARIAHAREDLDRALGHVGQALQRAPQNAEALGVCALLSLDAGQPEEAEGLARRALAAQSRQHEALIVVGAVLVLRREADAARQHLESALVHYPNSPRLLTAQAQALLLGNDVAAAQQQIARSVAIEPGHLGSWHVLAWTQLLKGERDAARRSFERAFEIDRNFAETHAGLAVVCALEGRETEAAQWARRARRLDPDSPTAVYAEALLRSMQGDAGAHERLSGLLARLPGEAGHGVDARQLLEASRRRLKG